MAGTAEELMRSRYSAFFTNDVDYLMSTHHPSKHEHGDKEQLHKTIASCKWLKLSITGTQRGLNNDTEGTIDFIAVYEENNQLFQLREKSHFIKDNNRWFYLDGDVATQQQANSDKIGRNDPCWCKSGKKYKKCHG
ncbi:MAG: SEC-C motif-containing protein [Pseudohongiellaceae bacterium]|jgi:SEC-C motif-containing protein